MRLPPVMKRTLRTAFHASGAMHLVRHRFREGVRILMYHRFPAGRTTVEALERQCAHLRRHHALVSLTEVGEALRTGEPLPPQSVAITVDDGYRDFYEVAFPIFSAHKVPVTVYLATDFLDFQGWLWVDAVRYLLTQTSEPQFDLHPPTGERRTFPLRTPEERSRAVAALKAAAKGLPDTARRALLDTLPDRLGVRLPERPPAQLAALRWDEVRQMLPHRIDFGAHTKSHPILSQLPDDEALRAEIVGSRCRIEQETGAPVLHFCYPNGRKADIGPRTLAVAREADFLTAVTTEPGRVLPGADRLMLPRIATDPSHPERQFREWAAGWLVGYDPTIGMT